ncbi:MAG: hypothetical protein H7X93_03815 [Sphingomonadaceae bacterium]|nr:hypothetical protein [Sphingomonadaceae bacterium]
MFRAHSRRELAAIVRGARVSGVDAAAAARHFGRPILVEIDPRRVLFQLPSRVLLGGGTHRLGRDLVDAADWGACLSTTRERRAYREMRKLVAHRADFRELALYRRMAARIAAGEWVARSGIQLATIETLDAYFEHYARLIAAIRDEGYAAAEAAAARGVPGAWGNGRPDRDVSVAIGAEGEPIRYLGGNHRFAIACELGVSAIRCEVRLIHFNWLARRADEEGIGLYAMLERLHANPATLEPRGAS